MKSIKEAQSDLVNDTCAECGSFVDIGAVVEESDVLLQLPFSGKAAKADAEALADKAKARFNDVIVRLTEQDNVWLLQLEFGCSAEKMIFQLQNSLP
ncbi:DUF406 family protein [Shewanella fodinae]|jgi:uncharacterized protein YfcZ (UPF0381/DUF406 family)|uniref:Uncharacterized protein YfcZ (UPF0381/DUF406 family) n=1 Tax=Shewanella fodinae TaxID=552357 RepID=A0A4V2RRR2_9GAMM|nr:DUF406 family protein [Shewanella fodinae]MDN5369516.1 hypothetical protein [Shewanella sp.]TCN80842.1 uncharacterized protein YfcZ (UPF0381/DUF406 family) [Shewanella fodinae]